jgi:hypothetical protein
MKQAEAEAEKKLQALEDEAKKLRASEVDAKKLFLDQEKSLREAAEKLLQKENQLKDSEAEKKRILIENEQLQYV